MTDHPELLSGGKGPSPLRPTIARLSAKLKVFGRRVLREAQHGAVLTEDEQVERWCHWRNRNLEAFDWTGLEDIREDFEQALDDVIQNAMQIRKERESR